MNISKYSIGTGDRFGQQGKAQLEAVIKARDLGAELAIVWNKSHREHRIIKTTPRDQRIAADQAVTSLNWKGQYFVDADHISLENVDPFLPCCDFFTIDVADFIGTRASEPKLTAFIEKYRGDIGDVHIPGLDEPLHVSTELLYQVAGKYLRAVEEAGNVYRHIQKNRYADEFVAEISIDETREPQTPAELFVILAAVADEQIPVQTIAPKFSGRFNKGIDYTGDPLRFRQEFEADVCVIRYAITAFGLPENLKVSVHSGSDKFSIYPQIREVIRKHDVGLHIKTAGTTWLEELCGLAEYGGNGLKVVKEIYRQSYARLDEFCVPYAAVIAIDPVALPDPAGLQNWTGEQFARAVRHDQSCTEYNPHLRQLLHVGFKVAAEMGSDYLKALKEAETVVSRNVTDNLLNRHITPLFLE